MIVVREVFQLKYGKARDAKQLLKEAMPMFKKYITYPMRLLTDLVGPAYILVMESEHESLAAFETSLKSELGEEEWRTWYQKFIPLVESSRREIFTIVDL